MLISLIPKDCLLNLAIYLQQMFFPHFNNWSRISYGMPNYYSAKLSCKLYENETKFNREGGSRPKFYYVDPSLLTPDKYIGSE